MTKRIMPTGDCFCGCGEATRVGSYFVQGHDRRAEVMMTNLIHGSVLARLTANGYGPGEKNLSKEYEGWKAAQQSE